MQEQVLRAASRLGGRIKRTPVLTSQSLDTLAGRSLFFKVTPHNRTSQWSMVRVKRVPAAADLSLSTTPTHPQCENLQVTGSFKARGALNAVTALLETDKAAARSRGVVCHSAGNHGAALAWAATDRGIPCKVVVPNTTPKVKRDAIEAFGATLVW